MGRDIIMLERNYLSGIKLNSMPPEYSYLHDLPVVRYLNKAGSIKFEKPVTFLVGENGTGKSTLLEGIQLYSDI